MIAIHDDIIEQIIIIMIKNKQYADLNNFKQIPRLNKLINNNKKYYLLPFVKKMALHASGVLSKMIKLYRVNDIEYHMPPFGILTNIIISGNNISKVEIIIGYNKIFTYHYLNASIVNIKPIPEGIHLYLMPYSEFYIKIYGKVNSSYGRTQYSPAQPIYNSSEFDYFCKSSKSIKKNNLIYVHGMCNMRWV